MTRCSIDCQVREDFADHARELVAVTRTRRCDDDLLVHSFLNSVHGPQTVSHPGPTAIGHYQARRAAAAVENAGWTVDLRFAGAEQDAA